MAGKEGSATRTLVVHFSGGTEVSLQTLSDPTAVYEKLAAAGDWLIVEDVLGESHYLAVGQIAYLHFASRKGVGFRYDQ